METYSLIIECRNCWGRTVLNIPKGTLRTEHMKVTPEEQFVCDTCGCTPFPNGWLLVPYKGEGTVLLGREVKEIVREQEESYKA